MNWEANRDGNEAFHSMNNLRKPSIKEKCLAINLDEKIYGSFAEIGAGQEVAANFFKAGGASGTVAKTISAYDMTFSDAIYGQVDRYVSEPRLLKMLEKEFHLLTVRLSDRADTTRFFAFSNTVAALNYQKTNMCHGWIGVRFQSKPNSEPNDCIMHVVLKDNDNLLQQQAIGMVGVNLIHACYFIDDPDDFLESLVDGIDRDRIEIDMFRLEGPDFKSVDNRVMSLKLVKKGLTNAAMFGSDRQVLQPSEYLYRKNVLVLRGRFRPVTHVNVDMLLTSRRRFKEEKDVNKNQIRVICELTLSDLTLGGKDVDEEDFLSRVDIICSLGQDVMISNYYEYYRLVRYLSTFTRSCKIGIILGVYNLKTIFDESYYSDLRGGILESFGSLFGNNVKLYVYPSLKRGSKEVLTLKNLDIAKNLKGLYTYLRDNNKLEDITGANQAILDIVSDDVLVKIKNDDPAWEDMVPRKVVQAIRENRLFDCPGESKSTPEKKGSKKSKTEAA